MNKILTAGILVSVLLFAGCGNEKERIEKYGNNNVKSIAHVDENGKLIGKKKNFTYNGELESVENYENGKKQGEQIFYFTDGSEKVRSKYWYHEGKKTGTLFLDKSGTPIKRLGYYKKHG